MEQNVKPARNGVARSVGEAEWTFDTSQIINPGNYPYPKEGHIGYVKVEDKHYEGPELKPSLFEVDLQCWESVG